MQAPSIEELRVGNAPAWSWFVSEYGLPVRHYARRLGHPDPDEVAGATMETIVRRINHFEGGQPELRSFVFSVAHARIVDELRGTHRKREVIVPVIPEAIDQSDEPHSTNFGSNMETALQQLTEKQQHAIRLRYVDGMSTREVAQVTGESEGSTRVSLSRGLHKLRYLLVSFEQ
jgi:RNA polymerase sigma-70 factor (ECF subfamily)